MFVFNFLIEVQLIYNIVLVSGVHKSDSAIYTYSFIYNIYSCIYNICILSQILLSFRLLQNIEYSSLCYTVGPCWLSFLYIVQCYV